MVKCIVEGLWRVARQLGMLMSVLGLDGTGVCGIGKGVELGTTRYRLNKGIERRGSRVIDILSLSFGMSRVFC